MKLTKILVKNSLKHFKKHFAQNSFYSVFFSFIWGPLVTDFYKNYHTESVLHALAPIDVDEIKNHYDEH